jgi:hypothetical protein
MICAFAFTNMTQHSRGVNRPSFEYLFRPTKGVGNAGRPMHPQPRV